MQTMETGKYKFKKGLPLFAALTFFAFVLLPGTVAGETLSDGAKVRRIDAMYASYKKSFPQVPDLSAAEVLKRMTQEKVTFVDIRKDKEQVVSTLPGAVAHKEFLKNPSAYANNLIIGYCTISYRSGKLARKLKKKGIRMINLRGGILAWLHAGGKVYHNGEPVKKVHVYGRKWNLAPTGYKAVW